MTSPFSPIARGTRAAGTPVGGLLKNDVAAKKTRVGHGPNSPLDDMDDEPKPGVIAQSEGASATFLDRLDAAADDGLPPAEPEEVLQEPVTMRGIAALLKNQLRPVTSVVAQLRKDFVKLEAKVTAMGDTLSDRMEGVETELAKNDFRIEKLEHMCEVLEKRPGYSMDEIEDKIQESIRIALTNEALSQEPGLQNPVITDKRTVTM
eukprot:4776575-Pyramimonas_sp.AAC.1